MAYKKHFITVDTKTLLGSSYNPPLLGVVVKCFCSVTAKSIYKIIIFCRKKIEHNKVYKSIQWAEKNILLAA